MGLTLARVPSRVSGELKDTMLKLVDEAVAAGWPHGGACRTLGVSDVRMHRWRRRLFKIGTAKDRAPGGNPVHRLVGWEQDAVMDLIEVWGPTDRTHRKLAYRGCYLGVVFVSPSTLLRVANSREVTLGGGTGPALRDRRRSCPRSSGNRTGSGSSTPPTSPFAAALCMPLSMWCRGIGSPRW